MKLGPVALEPDPGLLGGGRGLLYEPPEAGTMVHLAHMRDFMCCDIVQNKWRRKDEPP